jgi:hypothetical protein
VDDDVTVCQVEDDLDHGPHEDVDTRNFLSIPRNTAIRFELQHEKEGETQEMK